MQEGSALEADDAVIDAHHHIWWIDRVPWLQGPMQPRIFGKYSALQRDYGIDEFADEAVAVGVSKSVYVQVNVAPGDEVWEVGWAAEQGARRGLCQAIVSFADLASPDVGDVLDRQLAAGPLRGVRQQLHWHEEPSYRFARSTDSFLVPAWRKGLREVTARGLHFELQVFPGQFETACVLIDGHPDTRFVLLHCGMPTDHSPEGFERWRQGIQDIARRDNVLVKISGLGTFERSCRLNTWRPVVQATIEAFGANRCLFGSNLPIEKLWTDYATLLGVVRASIADLPVADRRAILRDTAANLYRI